MDLDIKIKKSRAATEARRRSARKRIALVEAFDWAAKTWGWEEDQGTGPRVDKAEADYKEAKAKLLAYIYRLQRRAKERQLK